MPVMGKKMAVAQDSYGSYQHDNQRIYYPCSVYGRGFWPAAGTIADDNTDSTLAYDIWLNDSSSAEDISDRAVVVIGMKGILWSFI